ncbi:MAG TPA: hypothetical protein DCE73_13640 [Paraprevotella xylaniphila]|nr:hypothetical protein [Paraprevotella xylaniphila]
MQVHTWIAGRTAIPCGKSKSRKMVIMR